MFIFPQISSLSDFVALIVAIILFGGLFLYWSGKLLRFLIGSFIFAFTVWLVYLGINVIISTLIGGFLFIWFLAYLKAVK